MRKGWYGTGEELMKIYIVTANIKLESQNKAEEIAKRT